MTTESTSTVSPAKIPLATSLDSHVLAENLTRALALVSPAIDKRAYLPILSNVVIAADRGWLAVSATNLDMTIRSAVGAMINSEGQAIVSHVAALEFAKGAKDHTIGFSPGGTMLHVIGGRATTDLALKDPADYPIPQTFDPVVSFEASAAEWARCLTFAVTAVATDDSRPVLTAVLIEGKAGDSAVNVVAADGFRLHRIAMPLTAPLTEDLYILLSGPVVKATLRGIKTLKKTAAFVGVRANFATVGIVIADCYGSAEAFQLTASLIQGTFPNYGQLIPQANDQSRNVITFDPADLLAAVSPMVKLAKSGSGILRLRQAAADQWTVTARSTDDPAIESTAEFHAVTERPQTGPLVGDKIALNVDYLRASLASLPGGPATVSIESPSNSIAIRSAADDSLVCVVMPMFVQW